jgi:hypothetical protein
VIVFLDARNSVTVLLPLSSECTNELLSCMLHLSFLLYKIMAMCPIKDHISDGGTHA